MSFQMTDKMVAVITILASLAVSIVTVFCSMKAVNSTNLHMIDRIALQEKYEQRKYLQDKTIDITGKIVSLSDSSIVANNVFGNIKSGNFVNIEELKQWCIELDRHCAMLQIVASEDQAMAALDISRVANNILTLLYDEHANLLRSSKDNPYKMPVATEQEYTALRQELFKIKFRLITLIKNDIQSDNK